MNSKYGGCMRRLKLYLETSTISYLDQSERGEKYMSRDNENVMGKRGKWDSENVAFPLPC